MTTMYRHTWHKPDGRVETPQAVTVSVLLLPHERQRSRVYAIEGGKELTLVYIID